MTQKPRCLGILRETQNSPNRQTDDAFILEAVLAELRLLDIDAKAMTPEQSDSADLSKWDMVVPMCESYPRILRLQAAAEERLIINPPRSVLNCYRVNMVSALSSCTQALFPPSEIRRVDEGLGKPPSFKQPVDGWWIKRGDVHNTCDHDVIKIDRWSGLQSVLEDFRSREITHFVAQPHIEGDLIKFYGVGPGRWFAWFYHNPSQAQGLRFHTDDLSQAASAAAAAVRLEVFGGDAIVGPEKNISIIDINSWPSFAKVRGGAAPHIARHLAIRLQNFMQSRSQIHPPSRERASIGAGPKPSEEQA